MESLVEILILQMEKGGSAELTVTGWSMLPMLQNRRDVVTLIPPTKEPKKKDVVLYRRKNGQYVLHRIIDIEDGTYIISGDNQAVCESVEAPQIIAVVSGFTHKGRPYSVQSFGYRIYAWIWVELFCLRKGYLFIRRRVGRLLSKIRRKPRK